MSFGSPSPLLSPRAQEWEWNETGVPFKALGQCDRQEGLAAPRWPPFPTRWAGLHLLVGTWEG